MLLAQLSLNALILGAAYALVAIGFVLILNATGAVNFAQGDLVMVGGFCGVGLAGYLPVSGLVLLPLVAVIMGLLGMAIALCAYFPLSRRPPEAMLISTIAVGIILQNGANLLFGPDAKAPPALLGNGDWRVGGLVLSQQGMAVLLVAILLVGSLQLVFSKTQLGRRLRATAQDRDVASALGIPVNTMIAATFGVGIALSGIAGLLLTHTFFVTPTDGGNYMLKAYIAVVLGGWGSLPGAVAGALLIAFFEVIFPSLPVVAPFLANVPGASEMFTQTASTIVFDCLVLVVLLFRPQGLFGEAMQVRP